MSDVDGAPAGRRVWPRLLLALALLLAGLFGAGTLVVARLRPEVEQRLSERIEGRVTIGALHLAPLAGGLRALDVAIRPAEPGAAPVATIGELTAAVALRPLLDRNVEVSAIALERVGVDVDRLEDGGVNLVRLVKPAGPAPAVAGAGPGWSFAIDRIDLRNGRLRYRDFVVGGGKPVEIAVPELAIGRIALPATGSPELPPVRFETRIGDGTLDADLTLHAVEDRLAVDGTFTLKDLPLDPARVYVPRVGWSRLAGTAGGKLSLTWASDGPSRVEGDLSVTGLAITVPKLDAPALSWRSLAATGVALDLRANRAAIGSLAIDDASVVVTPGAPELLPLLQGVASAPAGPAPGEMQRAWSWTVSQLAIRGSKVSLRAPGEELDLGVELAAAPVSGDRGAATAVKLAVRDGDGTLAAEGRAELDPAGFEGNVTLAGVSLPRLLLLASPGLAALIEAATLDGSLHVTTDTRTGDLVARGDATLSEVALATEDPRGFGGRALRVEIAADRIELPGVLAQEPKRTRPVRVALAKVRLVEPDVTLTRAAEGLLLPKLPAGSGGGPPVRVDIGSFEIAQGRLDFSDRSVKPFYRTTLTALALTAADFALPGPAARAITGTARIGERGQVDLTGHADPSGVVLVVDAKRLVLASFNPYAAAAGYSITRGDGDVVSSFWYGAQGFEAKNWLTLRDLRIGGARGESLFQQQYGVSLPVALALLRDASGSISLEVPIWQGAGSVSFGTGTALRSALRQALVGALASPLKLLGSVIPGGEEPSLTPPPPIPFPPGEAEMWADGYTALNMLAQLLVERPELQATLDGVARSGGPTLAARAGGARADRAGGRAARPVAQAPGSRSTRGDGLPPGPEEGGVRAARSGCSALARRAARRHRGRRGAARGAGDRTRRARARAPRAGLRRERRSGERRRARGEPDARGARGALLARSALTFPGTDAAPSTALGAAGGDHWWRVGSFSPPTAWTRPRAALRAPRAARGSARADPPAAPSGARSARAPTRA